MIDQRMLDYDFCEDEVYLAAVTYARSSMAMLDMMIKKHVNVVVCFVNYHTGEQIEDAQRRLEYYCDVRNIPFEACDTDKSDQTGKDTDYGEWARKVRYTFFEEMYKKHNASALFVAHTQDELIEDHLLTKKYGISRAHYGHGKVSSYHNMLIVRPFLHQTRSALAEYDDENGVPYSAHKYSATNENFHEKSEIKAEVERLNEIERGHILDEMRAKNDQKHSLHKSIIKSIPYQHYLDIRSLMALSKNDFLNTIITFVKAKAPHKFTVEPSKVWAIRNMCIDKKDVETLQLKDNIYMVKEYDILYLDKDGMNMPYSFILEKPSAFKNAFIDLDFTDGAEDRNVHLEDYPIRVRSCLPQDTCLYDGYLTPVRKMLRESGLAEDLIPLWPVIINKDDKIIYVPHYRPGFVEYHSSKMKLNLEEAEKNNKN